MMSDSPRVRSAGAQPTTSRTATVIAIGALAASFLVLHGLSRLTVDVEVLRIGEQTLWTWLTSTLFAASALSSLGFMALQPPGRRWAWAAVAALMLVLSVDEVATVHEQLEDEVGSQFSFFLLQPLLALAAVALFVRLMRALDREARLWVALAAAALVLAQAGSTLSAEAGLPEAANTAQAIAEELLEMLVPAFILAATLPAVWPRVRGALEPDAPEEGVGRAEPLAPRSITRR